MQIITIEINPIHMSMITNSELKTGGFRMILNNISNNTRKGASIILITVAGVFSAVAQDAGMVRPAPQGILLLNGMNLANGKKVDHYTIERSDNKKQWDKVADVKSPSSWDDFNANIQRWKNDFPFQELPNSEILKELWQKCSTYGVIDSMKYWTASTIIGLAAGIGYYDKQAPKNKETWYRINSFDLKGKSISEVVSKSTNWPFFPTFDAMSLVDKNVDKKLYYLKWQSEGSNPAPYFSIKYYENLKLKEARGLRTNYKIGDKTFYIYQDSSANMQNDRQYFLVPMDVYGNPGVATGITIVSKASAARNYFANAKAASIKKGYGLALSWKLSNPVTIKGIKIYRSDSFDKKIYELAATVAGTDTSFNDMNVQPDKIYYYYLVTESNASDFPVQSNIFFDVTYDQLKPVQPSISSYKSIPGGVELTVSVSEMNIAGVRIYRNDGVSGKLLPVSDLIKTEKSTITFRDTSKTLVGGISYTYTAKIENTSHQESEFSNQVYVMPDIKTVPPVATRLVVTEENHQVNLIWDNMKEQSRTIKGYVVFRRELPSGKFSPLLPADSISMLNYYRDNSVKPGQNYEYAVQSIDYFGGKSDAMAVYTIEVSEDIPPVPASLSVVESDGKLTIQWGEIFTKEPLQLNIYRYQRGAKPILLKTISLKDTQFIDNTIKKGELYFYYSKLINNAKKESPASSEVSIRVN